MNILSPSILSADFKNLERDIKETEKGGAKWLHIDVMDGIFVPSISYGMPVIKSIRPCTDLFFDVHLMITEPIRYIEDFKASGADLITIHTEACEDIKATLEKIHEAGLKAGLSIKPKTPVETVIPYLPMVDMILLMSVEPGFGGQSFVDGSLERAAELRRLIDEHCAATGRHIDLEIDGGVNKDNVQDILDAGVNVIVAGSAVFKAPYENTEYFMKILEG